MWSDSIGTNLAVKSIALTRTGCKESPHTIYQSVSPSTVNNNNDTNCSSVDDIAVHSSCLFSGFITEIFFK